MAPEVLYNEMFTKVFRNSLFELSSHHCGNFVIQALISHAGSQDQVCFVTMLLFDTLYPSSCSTAPCNSFRLAFPLFRVNISVNFKLASSIYFSVLLSYFSYFGISPCKRWSSICLNTFLPICPLDGGDLGGAWFEI